MVSSPRLHLALVALVAAVIGGAAGPGRAAGGGVVVVGGPAVLCADGAPADRLATAIAGLPRVLAWLPCRTPGECARAEAVLETAFDDACRGDATAALSGVAEVARASGLRRGSSGGGSAYEVSEVVDAALALAAAKGAEAPAAVEAVCRDERPPLEARLEGARGRLERASERTPRDGRAAALLALGPLASALGELERVAQRAEASRARCFPKACRSDGAALFEPGPAGSESLVLLPPGRGDVAVYRVEVPLLASRPVGARAPTAPSAYREPDLVNELDTLPNPPEPQTLAWRSRIAFDGPGRTRVSVPRDPLRVRPRLALTGASSRPVRSLVTRAVATADCVDAHGWLRTASASSSLLAPPGAFGGGDRYRVRVDPASAALPPLTWGPLPPRVVEARVGDSLVEPGFRMRAGSGAPDFACSGSHRVAALEESAGPDGPLRTARIESRYVCDAFFDETWTWWLASGIGFVRAEARVPGAPEAAWTQQLVCFETPATPGRCDEFPLAPEP